MKPAAGARPVGVTRTEGLDGVPPLLWRRLNPRGGLFTEQRFMTVFERVEPMPPATARVYTAESGGEAVGFLPAFGPVPADGSRYDPLATARSADPGLPEAAWRAPVVLGSRSGYENRVFVAPHLARDDRAAVLRALVAEASEGFAVPWSMPYLDFRSATEVRAAVPEAGDALLVGADCVLDVPPGGFEEYLAGMTAKRRISVRRELRRFEELGCAVEVGTLAEHSRELGVMLAANLRKHGAPADTDRLLGVFEGYAEAFRDDAFVLLARSGGRTVAYVTVYRWGDALYLRSWGAAPGYDTTGAVYFTLAYYEPMRRAPGLGARRIHLGLLSYRAKALRGARFDPRWTFLHSPHAPPSPRATRRWNDEQLAQFLALTGESWQTAHDRLARGRAGGGSR